jgi:hypothetical protein
VNPAIALWLQSTRPLGRVAKSLARYENVHGDYWADLAVRWLSDGFPMDEAIAGAGHEMITARRGSQEDRHALFRMIRAWERNR